jgi:hypothetical protein
MGDDAGVLPYSVLLGADGRVLETHVGVIDPPTLERWLGPEAAR